jgi:hypothetical protein
MCSKTEDLQQADLQPNYEQHKTDANASEILGEKFFESFEHGLSTFRNKKTQISEEERKKYEELRAEFGDNICQIFAEFLHRSEKVTPGGIDFFKNLGTDIEEPNSYYPTKSKYSNALHYACENRLYDKVEALLESDADPNILIGKNSKCCDCISAVDVVLCSNQDFSNPSTFAEMEKYLRLLIKHGALYEISQDTSKMWKELVVDKGLESNGFVKRFIDHSKVREGKDKTLSEGEKCRVLEEKTDRLHTIHSSSKSVAGN